MFCHDLRTPEGVVVVGYDPAKEHVASHPGNYLWDVYELLRLLRPRFAENAATGLPPLAIDIGANVGYFTMSVAARGRYRVVAFEPAPANFRRLALGVHANGFGDRVSLFRLGLGHQDDVAQLFLDPESRTHLSNGVMVNGWDDKILQSNFGQPREKISHVSPSSSLTDVNLTTLDRFHQRFRNVLKGADILKMDAEGFEPLIIAGAIKFLWDERPALILMEFHFLLWTMRAGFPGYRTVEEVLHVLMIGLGYIPYSTRKVLKLGVVEEAFFDVDILLIKSRAALTPDSSENIDNEDVLFVNHNAPRLFLNWTP